MCKLETCPVCQQPTWIGCGRHIDAIMGSIAPGDRCPAASEHGAERAGEDALVNAACLRSEMREGDGSLLSAVVSCAAGASGAF